MIVSEARLTANRLNSLKAKGPTSTEGKLASRRNACKHLLASEVIAPEAHADEIARRVEALTAEMNPRTEAGTILIAKLATLSIRMERAADHETAAIAFKVRHAGDDFDDTRYDQANALLETLADDPRSGLRKLKRMPEGTEKLIEAWDDLRADLASGPWTDDQLERAANLIGMKSRHAQSSRLGDLNRAIGGDFGALAADDGAGLNDDDRKGWAKDRLIDTIDAEVAALEEHYLALDFETLAVDRSEAGTRALFDPSKPACLARRYESEASRGFFKTLKEFRQVEAEFAAQAEAAPAASAPSGPPSKVGSFRRETPPSPFEPARPRPDAPDFLEPADLMPAGEFSRLIDARQTPG